MLVMSSSDSGVLLKMATFTFEEQHVIIRFLHLCGMKPIEIHQQLSETCNDDVMGVKNVRSWIQQFKEGRTSCENKPKEPRLRTSRSEDMIARVVMVAMFWDNEGVILMKTYEDVLRTKFLPAMREKRPKKAAAVPFHHDNAPHRTARVHQYFDDNNFEDVPTNAHFPRPKRHHCMPHSIVDEFRWVLCHTSGGIG